MHSHEFSKVNKTTPTTTFKETQVYQFMNTKDSLKFKYKMGLFYFKTNFIKNVKS